jgi:hypothetical protein
MVCVAPAHMTTRRPHVHRGNLFHHGMMLKLVDLLSSEPGTESGVPHEIQRLFDLSSLRTRNLELVCGFKCGMLYNAYGDSCGLWYLLVNPGQADANSETKPTGKRWLLIGCPISRSGFETFASIEAVLKEWARIYVAWAEQM